MVDATTAAGGSTAVGTAVADAVSTSIANRDPISVTTEKAVQAAVAAGADVPTTVAVQQVSLLVM